jgi:lipopolysaccharide export system protein LptC
MSSPEPTTFQPKGRAQSAVRWRRRSRLVATLRWLLPAAIGVVFLALIGAVVWNSVSAPPAAPKDSDEPIRLINPRFVGKDDKGRAFVITALTATRDPKEYQRVILEKPALVLDEGGPDAMRVGGVAGVYHEGDRKLELSGGVKMSSAQAAFETDASEFDTKTGELVGQGPIQGSGQLGQINAQSYAVYGRGERTVFKGGVHARIEKK